VTHYASGYPHRGPYYFTPPPPSPPPQNGFGTAGFVLGLLGLLFSVVPIIGVIAWPLVLLSLVSAGVGLSRVSAGRATNKAITIAGLICAAIGLLMCIAHTPAVSAAVSPRTAPAPAAAVPGPARSVPADRPGPAGIGTEVRDGEFAFAVTEVQTGVQVLGEDLLRSEAQGSYVLVHVTVTNIGTESQLFTGASQKLFDAQGREFSADTGAAIMSVPDSRSFLTAINPGNSVDGVLVFDMPEGLAPAAIELHESMFSPGVRVTLAG
jgi:Domain of unknown function (DUF4352)